MQVGTHSVAFSTMVNAGLVYSGKESIVIDTMHGPAKAQMILDEANSRGLNVSYVFNTHSHFDHTFGNSLFDAPVVASMACASTLRSFGEEKLREMARNNAQCPGDYTVTMPSLTFSQAMEIEIEGLAVRFEVYGGHTPGNSIAIVEKDGVIFSGDLLFIGRYPYVGSADLRQWCLSLRRLIDFSSQFRCVVPGHGPVLTGSAIRGEIGTLLSFFETTLSVASRLAETGASKEEALNHPGFPWIRTEQPDADKRRAVCIERAYNEVLSWGSR